MNSRRTYGQMDGKGTTVFMGPWEGSIIQGRELESHRKDNGRRGDGIGKEGNGLKVRALLDRFS
jgi:hypothetical protein